MISGPSDDGVSGAEGTLPNACRPGPNIAATAATHTAIRTRLNIAVLVSSVHGDLAQNMRREGQPARDRRSPSASPAVNHRPPGSHPRETADRPGGDVPVTN